MSKTIPLWKIHVAEGFKEDCNELMRRCSQLKKLSYEKFCNIWKEMDFACVYYSTQSGAETAEFSDEVIHIAKSYMFSNTANFEETVAGLFLVYALLNLQPFVDFSSIKIIHEDVKHIERVERMARTQRRYDVLYILGSILIKGPCQYQLAQRERGLEYTIRKYLEEDGYEFHGGVKGVFTKDKEELDLLAEIKEIGMKYSKNKLSISGSTKVNRNLSYTNDTIPLYLETSLKNVIYGFNMQHVGEVEIKKDSQSTKNNTPNTISSIKEKAMKLSVNSMRHLTGLQEREISPKKTPSQKSPKSQSKTPSPRKTMTRKRKTSKTVSRIVFESSDESDSCLSLHDDSDDTIKPSVNSDKTRTKTGKASIKKVKTIAKKEKSSKKIDKASADSNENNSVKAIKHDNETVEIKTDSLPVLITAPDEMEYVIEIIDHCTDAEHNIVEAKTTEIILNEDTKKEPDTNTQDEEHSDTKIATRNKLKTNNKSNKTQESVDDNNICEETAAQKRTKKPMKREKRDLKNNQIASSFNRMGLLDMVKVAKKGK